jgi:two-component system chemotaxis response regulator CheY
MGREFDFLDVDGAERALRLLRLVPARLVIVDLNMPKMDGLAFLRQLRSSEMSTPRRVPVVMVTSTKDPEIESRAIAAGADAFLQKPLSSARVCEVVDRLIPRA